MERPDQIGVDDLNEVGSDSKNPAPMAATVVLFINMLSAGVAPMREAHGGAADTALMTALVTFAGCVLGECQFCLGVPEMTDEAMQAMLLTNFKTGIAAGLSKCQRVKAAVEAANGEQEPTQ